MWNLRLRRESILGSLWREIMSMSTQKPRSEKRDLDGKAIDALMEARNMPPGPARIEALKRANQLGHAADTYKYLFSSELKPPE
jgi:hypothetical protein